MSLDNFADVILSIHFVIAFFIVSLFFVIPFGYKLNWNWIKNRKLRLLHLILISFVTVETILGITCPLTTMENNLRGINQPKSFVAYWVEQLVYWYFPTQFFLILYCVSLTWTILIWQFYPPKNAISLK